MLNIDVSFSKNNLNRKYYKHPLLKLISFRTKLYTTKDPEEVKETTILIQEIEAAPPVTAMDYFEVNKGTISTILGITVSYCIVMFQTVSCQ